jgi:hypothetical protein
LPQDAELYVWVESQARVSKGRAMRRRLKRLWSWLRALQRPTYETFLLKLGVAKKEAGRAWALVRLALPDPPPKTEGSRRLSHGHPSGVAWGRQRRGKTRCWETQTSLFAVLLPGLSFSRIGIYGKSGRD